MPVDKAQFEKLAAKLGWNHLVKPEDMTIAFVWTTFAGAVIPDVSELQRNTECFKVLFDYANAMPEDEVAALFSRLTEESHQFYLKMKKEHGR